MLTCSYKVEYIANVMKISPKPVSLTNLSAHQWEMKGLALDALFIKFWLPWTDYQAALSLDAHRLLKNSFALIINNHYVFQLVHRTIAAMIGAVVALAVLAEMNEVCFNFQDILL